MNFILFYLFLFLPIYNSFFLQNLKNSKFFYHKHILQIKNKNNKINNKNNNNNKINNKNNNKNNKNNKINNNNNNNKINYIVNHNKYNIRLEYNNITDYYYDNKFIKDKNIINIFPAGLKGFYEMGISVYIKEKYNMNNYIFSGASAGAWNSLLLAYKGNISDFKNFILDFDFHNLHSVYQLQINLKNKILLNFSDNDFDFSRMFIGVTVLEKMRLKNYIYTDFDSLEDALNCIVASSNIPFFTGKIIYKYRNKISFDGGFSRDPYIHNPNTQLIIHSNLFTDFTPFNQDINCIDEWINIINDDVFDIHFDLLIKLFEKGYYDASHNVKYIEKFILHL